MSYINAKDILPENLLLQIKEYYKSGMLYIPLFEDEQNSRDGLTETRNYIHKRNNEICAKKLSGYKINELADEYHLSVDSIKSILYR